MGFVDRAIHINNNNNYNYNYNSNNPNEEDVQKLYIIFSYAGVT